MGVIKSIYNGAKNFINGIKNTIKKIGNAVKFFISPIGGVVGWILLGIFIMILLFAIGKTGARALRNLFGEDWNYSTYSGDLEVIEQLYDSGYEAVISAENFQDFKAFEYAVLMDAAEYLRNNDKALSVLPVGHTTNQSRLAEQGQDRLNQLVLQGANSRSVNVDGEIAEVGTDGNNTRVTKPILVYEFKLSTLNQDELLSGDGSGENTTANLLEEGKLKGSLEPYVYIIRDDIIFSYFFFSKGEQPMVVEYSMMLNAYNTTLMFGREMANQISAANMNSSEIKVFPDDTYDLVPYYTDATTNVVYKIPLRTLLGRYMPRAELLQAWALLKQDIDEPDKDKEDIIDELLASIKGVYNEACLEGEQPTPPDVVEKVKSGDSNIPNAGKTYYYSDATTHNSTFVTFATAGLETTDYGINGFSEFDGTEKTDITLVTDFNSALIVNKTIEIEYQAEYKTPRPIYDENGEDTGKVDKYYPAHTYISPEQLIDYVSCIQEVTGILATEGSPEEGYTPPSEVKETQTLYAAVGKKEEDISSVIAEIQSGIASHYKNAKILTTDFLEYNPIFITEDRKLDNKLNINHSRMSVLLIDSATTWARKINYSHNLTQNRFKPDDKYYIIPSCVSSMGLEKFETTLKNEETYRGKAYRDIFARMKEKDVINTLLQLEQGGIEGTADCYEYMRDVYKLLETAKKYSAENPDSSNRNNNIHENTYSYVYIPDTILHYNDTATQKIYWLNIFAADKGVDAISKEELETMKTKDNEITWQVVEYEKYPECSEDGNVKVYALSPFGSVYARAFYQNVYESTTKNGDHSNLHEYIQGDFGDGHTGCDWGGRRTIKRVLSGASADDNDPYGKEIYDYELGRLSNIYGEDKAKKMIKDEIQEQLVNNPVVAIAPGRVETVMYESRAGFYVKIVHSEENSGSGKIASDYLHLKRWPLVNKGDYVGAGTVLGYEGNTGRSYGSHVHFEIEVNSVPNAPYDYIFPAFNCFYNREKAEEEVYNISSEYMSLYRTMSMVDADGGIPTKVKTGTELTNQQPKKALVENYNDLIQNQGKRASKSGDELTGNLGWNSSCSDSKSYIKYLQSKKYYDINTKEAFFNKKLAQEQGYLDIPPELLLAIYGSMCVNTTMPGSLPPLTENELKYILNNWLPSRYNEKEVAWLMKNVFTDATLKAIIEAEEQYHVSPVFALAVATLEQQLGLSYVRNNKHILGKPGIYNIFSIKGTKGGGVEYQSPGTMWNVYNSYGHAFQEFSALIAEGKYYFTQGKYTIAEIGATYCPPGDSWTSQVSSIVMEIMQYYTGNWSSLPSQIIFNVGSNADLVEAMKNCMDYLNLHKNNFKYGYSVSVPPYSNNSTSTQWGSPRCSEMDCSAYVSWVIYEVAKANNCQGLLNEFGRWSSYDFDDLGKDLSRGKTTGVCQYFQLVCARKDIPGGKISKVKDKLQAGDIIVYHEGSGHHVEFVKETGKTNVYTCGSASGWKNPGAQSYTRRSDVTWIIRLKSTL